LAPITVAILPLSRRPELQDKAKEIQKVLKKEYMTEYDETASIGKRYRRQDEIGTPYCVTVDFETANDNSVTVRDRDSMKQDRVRVGELANYLKDKFEK
jgi:glycyl-tRNA synthetase